MGVTQITSGTRRYGWGIAGNEATVVATLVNEPTRATLFAYDAGSARAISGVFAGRRLAWPTGSANVFVSEGAALFADAITWLASGDSLPTGSAPTFLTNPADLVSQKVSLLRLVFRLREIQHRYCNGKKMVLRSMAKTKPH